MAISRRCDLDWFLGRWAQVPRDRYGSLPSSRKHFLPRGGSWAAFAATGAKAVTACSFCRERPATEDGWIVCADKDGVETTRDYPLCAKCDAFLEQSSVGVGKQRNQLDVSAPV